MSDAKQEIIIGWMNNGSTDNLIMFFFVTIAPTPKYCNLVFTKMMENLLIVVFPTTLPNEKLDNNKEEWIQI